MDTTRLARCVAVNVAWITTPENGLERNGLSCVALAALLATLKKSETHSKTVVSKFSRTAIASHYQVTYRKLSMIEALRTRHWPLRLGFSCTVDGISIRAVSSTTLHYLESEKVPHARSTMITTHNAQYIETSKQQADLLGDLSTLPHIEPCRMTMRMTASASKRRQFQRQSSAATTTKTRARLAE